MEATGAEHMSADQLDQGRQRTGAGADPIGERRYVKVDALTCEALALPVPAASDCRTCREGPPIEIEGTWSVG